MHHRRGAAEGDGQHGGLGEDPGVEAVVVLEGEEVPGEVRLRLLTPEGSK